MLKALNLDPYRYCEQAANKLSAWMQLDQLSGGRKLKHSIDQYDILLLRFSHRLDADLLRHARRLKIIACNATGVDHIDVKAAMDQGIEIISLKGETAFLDSIQATAEFSWGLLLSCLRMIPQAHSQVMSGIWDRNQFFATELYGKAMGILGFGRIGKKIARYAHAFGMRVYAYDHQHRDYPDYVTALPSLEALCAVAEVLSVHVSYDRQSHQLLNQAVLSLLPKNAVLINSSRGAVIDEQALLALLDTGHIASAAVDVLVDEMKPHFLQNNPLVDYARNNNNLIITPHIAGVTAESWEKTENFIAEKIIETLRQKDYGFSSDASVNSLNTNST
ncbi:MAG: hypothetical protein KTR20_09190 [Cellvibrionaceae bacterium]|nr:hypothetical protein [Cellvibrionaceae bacterium]